MGNAESVTPEELPSSPSSEESPPNGPASDSSGNIDVEGLFDDWDGNFRDDNDRPPRCNRSFSPRSTVSPSSSNTDGVHTSGSAYESAQPMQTSSSDTPDRSFTPDPQQQASSHIPPTPPQEQDQSNCLDINPNSPIETKLTAEEMHREMIQARQEARTASQKIADDATSTSMEPEVVTNDDSVPILQSPGSYPSIRTNSETAGNKPTVHFGPSSSCTDEPPPYAIRDQASLCHRLSTEGSPYGNKVKDICTVCQNGIVHKSFTICGICCAILFFPAGIICCYWCREKYCDYCGN